MSAQMSIFTVGHSSHAMGSFLWLLRQHRIEAVVDIRRYPGSRKHPHFHRESLTESLAEEDIEYHWLEALGGRRRRHEGEPPSPNQGLSNQSFRSYADYMATDEFRRGLAQLLGIGRARRTAIMCAEALYWQCHRRLVSDCLLANDVAVQHIFPTGEVRPHQLTPGSRIVDGTVTYPGPPTLFEKGEP